MLNNIAFLIGATLVSSTPLVYAALGGLINERSGVVNIGLEGIMTMGAFVGVSVAYFTGNPWLAFLASGISGIILAAIHAVSCVIFRSDQIITGLAINIISPSLAFLISRVLFDNSETTPALPLEAKMPIWFSESFISGSFLANIFQQRSVVYIAIISVVVIHFFIYKTKWGLHILVAGENPETLHSMGISVNKVRFFSVIFSGFLVGLAGGSLVLNTVSIFRVGVISGQGFIAIAALIFGRWHPIGVYFSCLFFGFAMSLEVLIGANSYLSSFIPSSLLAIFPYVVTLIALIFCSRKVRRPQASGNPFVVE